MMPAIRGMDSILWACVENRPEWIGITVQMLAEGLDKGSIVSQCGVRPCPGENPYSTIARATMVGADLMIAAVDQALMGDLPALPTEVPQGTYRSALTADAIRRLHELCTQTERRARVNESSP
jgi:methionyl-tRNA formyltransferase